MAQRSYISMFACVCIYMYVNIYLYMAAVLVLGVCVYVYGCLHVCTHIRVYTQRSAGGVCVIVCMHETCSYEYVCSL